MDPVIEIRNLSKSYRLGERSQLYGSFREAMIRGITAPFTRRNGKGRAAREPFWAVRDINVDVHQGDTIGIIGSNGAGKSTILKIISRITDPSSGEIRVRGRIGSLLEVGTGFHPELTGRENVYLNGAILGMKKTEIQAKFDEIVNFSGVGPFLDTPVKRYSSGMYVRLAFAIAAHLDPEILIVDEVLAVGDVAFQKKCLGKMAEASSRSRTLLFVSHNLAAVESLCNRGIVLQHGRLVFDGSSKDAVQFYLHNVEESGAGARSHVVDLTGAPGRVRKYEPHLKRLELYHGDGRPLTGDVRAGEPLRAVVVFDLEHPCMSFDASIAFDTPTGQRVCTAHSAYEPDREHEERIGEQSFVCDIPSLPLVPGEYKIGVGLDIGGCEVDWIDGAASLTVLKSDYYGTGVIPTKGHFLLDNRWSLAHETSEVYS
ncbi:MAG TPA: ABC transporter ATP-binding protein [Candidatus Acidoferrum sp.]|nr:ABC transporter ATP-binding protein [Candidatus Acidoferrum sp.]